MPEYRIYLIIEDHIRAVEELVAECDAEVAALARRLFASCDDVFDACEVWRGDKIVYLAALPGNEPPERLIDLSEWRQKLVCEHEQNLADSFRCVRTSTKLLERLSALKDHIGTHGASNPVNARVPAIASGDAP